MHTNILYRIPHKKSRVKIKNKTPCYIFLSFDNNTKRKFDLYAEVNMNKIICAIICVAMLVSLTACSSGGGSGASDAHVFYYSYSDTYISNVRSALGRAFSANNIKYHDYDSNSNQTTQTEQVQTAITQ